MKLTIYGRLPGINEYTAACRRNPMIGNRMKREAEAAIEWSIRTAKLDPIPTPTRIAYTFYEPNKRRDMDNISGFAHKVIQDALVKSGKLPGDGWAYIAGMSDDFKVDKDNPRIEIEFSEVAE